MDAKVTVREAFEKLEQMLEYRYKQLENQDKSKFVKGLIQKEIDVLEFLADEATEALKAKGQMVVLEHHNETSSFSR